MEKTSNEDTGPDQKILGQVSCRRFCCYTKNCQTPEMFETENCNSYKINSNCVIEFHPKWQLIRAKKIRKLSSTPSLKFLRLWSICNKSGLEKSIIYILRSECLTAPLIPLMVLTMDPLINKDLPIWPPVRTSKLFYRNKFSIIELLSMTEYNFPPLFYSLKEGW